MEFIDIASCDLHYSRLREDDHIGVRPFAGFTFIAR